MKTITANIKEGIDQEIITEAGSILKDGGLVAFPTETVYGLGGNALDEQAAEKIYAAKGRPSDNPLIVHIAEFEALNKIAAEIPEEAKMLADAFWPGPLTMIFQKTDLVQLQKRFHNELYLFFVLNNIIFYCSAIITYII